MLVVRLEHINNDVAVYKYYPENKNNYGIISVNTNTGLIKENIPVKGEYGGENSMYRSHAFSTMRKFFKEKNFPKEWMTAWF